VKRQSFPQVITRILHSVLLTANAIVVLLLIVSGYAYLARPDHMTLLALFGYAFPFFALANVAFFIYWLIRFKIWMLFSLCGFLLTVGSYKAWFPINLIHDENTSGKTLTVLTFNVMNMDFVKGPYEDGLNPVVKYISETDADVVCMQETGEKFIRDYSNDPNVKKALRAYPYMKSGAWEGRYSVVCLSKYPVLRCRRIEYESQSNSSYLYDIKVNGQRIRIINNHLESNKLNPKEKDEYTQLITRRESKELTTVAEMLGSKVGNATSIRASQAVVVAKEIRNSPYQVVVCGDFNDVPGSYVYRTISKGMTDCWIDKGSGWGNTFHENLFLFRIDYILHSKNIETVTIKRDKVRISDHYPLLATLKIE